MTRPLLKQGVLIKTTTGKISSLSTRARELIQIQDCFFLGCLERHLTLKNGCFLTSQAPLAPNRCWGSFVKRPKIRLRHSGEKLLGILGPDLRIRLQRKNRNKLERKVDKLMIKKTSTYKFIEQKF